MKTAKEYRVEARQKLKQNGNFGTAIVIAILYSFIISAASATFAGGIILTGVFMVGYSFAMVQLFRKDKLDISDLFYGFKTNNFGATVGLFVQTYIFIFLWTCLFIVPGIIKSYSYAMAPYIMADHPEITGNQAITASKNLMKGKKGKLFALELSFIGWVLLGILTLGILYIWIGPWMSAAKSGFYESIKDEVVLEGEEATAVEQ